VVHDVNAAIFSEQAVPGLAVAAVDDQVEGADGLQRVVVLGTFEQREVVLVEVGVHEPLHRARSEGTVPLHGLGYQPPAQPLRHHVGGDLSAVEAGRVVPQRALAAERLVHGPPGLAVEGEVDEERPVRAPRQPSPEGDVAVGQQRQLARLR
jgi:hypothetical protein